MVHTSARYAASLAHSCATKTGEKRHACSLYTKVYTSVYIVSVSLYIC